MLRTLKISLGHWLRAPLARSNPPHAATRRRRSRLGPGLALASLSIVAALAYRSLVFWDPGGPGLPSIGWFVFGISDTAPQLVLAIVIGLLFQRRARIVRAIGEPRSPLLGAGSLLASGVLFFWGRHADAPEFLALSLALLLLGSALYVLGRRVARELVPPLLILLFAMPIPGIVLNHVLFPLQVAAAVQLAWLLEIHTRIWRLHTPSRVRPSSWRGSCSCVAWMRCSVTPSETARDPKRPTRTLRLPFPATGDAGRSFRPWWFSACSWPR
jgi:hypothetical protein